NWAVSNIVNPTLKRQYGDTAFQMRHTIGVDTSTLLVSRIGVRNDNDLVWVGRAANYAAKLSELDNDAYSLNITGAVFDKLADTSKFGGEPRQIMWKEFSWTTMNK